MTTNRRLVLATMCAGYFLVLLDVTIVNVSLPRIAAGLGAGVSGLQWVLDGYAIALASLMLAGGTVGDLHGHKRVVLAGFATFGAASLGCGLAGSTAMLVGFRVLQGVGAALMLPGTLAVIADAYPEPSEQARAIGLWASLGSVALAAGPLLGGTLTQTISWRAVFFVNVPIVAAASVLAARLVRERAEPRSVRLDRAGVALGALMLATLTFALIEGGHVGIRPAVLAASAAVPMLAAALIAVERSRRHPMLPLGLFKRPAFSVANALAATMNLGTLGLLFVLTLYLQDVHRFSTIHAGLALFPLFVPLSLIAAFSGRLVARLGARRPIAFGLALSAAGMALLTLAQPGSAYGLLLAALLPWGIGLGFVTPAVVAAAVGAVPPDRTGLASAVNNTARQAGGAIGIAAFGAVAGAPHGRAFLGGFHAVALVAAGLYLAGALAALVALPARRTDPALTPQGR